MKIREHRYKDRLEGWQDRIVVLWREDDARPPDREMSEAAFERIFGSRFDRAEAVGEEHNGGDWFARVDRYGHVLGDSCEGGFVGIVAEVV
jgi:hypothetical protein